MKLSYDEIHHILDNGIVKEKIKVLESLSDENNPEIIKKIVIKLDDPDIQVRGEVFSSLILNKNKITKFLIQSLNSDSQNIKGFGALILANRNETESIPSIIKLTKDSSSMVRSCALGALGYLKARDASNVIHSCFDDSSLEVKRSALKAAIDIGDVVESNEIEDLIKEKDPEIEKLLVIAKKK